MQLWILYRNSRIISYSLSQWIQSNLTFPTIIRSLLIQWITLLLKINYRLTPMLIRIHLNRMYYWYIVIVFNSTQSIPTLDKLQLKQGTIFWEFMKSFLVKNLSETLIRLSSCWVNNYIMISGTSKRLLRFFSKDLI